MKQGKGIIGLTIQNDKVKARFHLTDLNQSQVSLLITHLQIIKDELLNRYKQGINEVKNG